MSLNKNKIYSLKEDYIEDEFDYFWNNWYKRKFGQCNSRRDKKHIKLKNSWYYKRYGYYGINYNKKKLFLAEEPKYDEEEITNFKVNEWKKKQKKLYPKSEHKVIKEKKVINKRKRKRYRQKKVKNKIIYYNFNNFKREFLTKNLPIIEDAFGKNNYTLKYIYMSKNIENRFLESLYYGSYGYVLGYHGTNSINFRSIEKRGLLVPSKNNKIKVVNGSVHGVGIYTSLEYSNWLSLSFNDNNTLIGCAIVNNKEYIREVYDARVIFNENIIIPIVYIIYVDSNIIYNQRYKIKQKNINYLKHKPNDKPLWVGKRRKYIPECDEVIWLPPNDETWYSKKIRIHKKKYLSRLKHLDKEYYFIKKYY